MHSEEGSDGRLSELYIAGFCNGNKNSSPCTSHFSIEITHNFMFSIQSLSNEMRSAYLCSLLATSRQDGGSRSPAYRNNDRIQPTRIFNPYTLLGKRVCKRVFFRAATSKTDSVTSRLNSISRLIFTNESIDFGEKRGGCQKSNKIDQENTKRVYRQVLQSVCFTGSRTSIKLW